MKTLIAAIKLVWSVVCVYPLAYAIVLIVDAIKLEMLGCKQGFKVVPRCDVNGVDIGVATAGIEGASILIIFAVGWYITGIIILGLTTLIARKTLERERRLRKLD